MVMNQCDTRDTSDGTVELVPKLNGQENKIAL